MFQTLAPRAIAAASLASVLCWPATATTYLPSQGEQLDAALSIYLGCLRRMADRLDSPRATIDEVMVSAGAACTAPLARLDEAANQPEVLGDYRSEPWENRDWLQARLVLERQLIRDYLQVKRDSDAQNP